MISEKSTQIRKADGSSRFRHVDIIIKKVEKKASE